MAPHIVTLKEIEYDNVEQGHGIETRMGVNGNNVVSFLFLFR